MNTHIWYNEDNARSGDDVGNQLMLTHGLNGIRNTAKNKNFQLTLKIDPDIVYLNSVSKVTVNLERLVHKDSLSSSVTMSMKMDAVGGTLDMHSYGISSASSFSVSISDEEKSQFEVLASFVPSSTYSTSSGGYYYNYKENGLITASFNGLNVSSVSYTHLTLPTNREV